MCIAKHDNISYIIGSTVEALRRVQKCMSFSGPISGPRNNVTFSRGSPIICSWVLVSSPISDLRNGLCFQILGEQMVVASSRGQSRTIQQLAASSQ